MALYGRSRATTSFNNDWRHGRSRKASPLRPASSYVLTTTKLFRPAYFAMAEAFNRTAVSSDIERLKLRFDRIGVLQKSAKKHEPTGLRNPSVGASPIWRLAGWHSAAE